MQKTSTGPDIVRWDVATGRLASLGDADCAVLIGEGKDLWLSTVQSIRRVAKDGTGTNLVFRDETMPATGQWYDLAADASYVYWVDTSSPGGIYRGSKVGGAKELLAPATFPTGIAVDGDAVYWGDEDGVKKRSKSTGEIVTLSTIPTMGTLGAKTFQIDDEHVYWTSSLGVERVPKRGGTTTRFIQRPPGDAVRVISIQDGCMYFNAGAKLYRRPLTDGPEVTLATRPAARASPTSPRTRLVSSGRIRRATTTLARSTCCRSLSERRPERVTAPWERKGKPATHISSVVNALRPVAAG